MEHTDFKLLMFFINIFVWFVFISVLSKWEQFKQQKPPWWLDNTSLNNASNLAFNKYWHFLRSVTTNYLTWFSLSALNFDMSACFTSTSISLANKIFTANFDIKLPNFFLPDVNLISFQLHFSANRSTCNYLWIAWNIFMIQP